MTEIKYLYEVRYLDNMYGDVRVVEVEAVDYSDAVNQAYEDYCFGNLISAELLYPIE